MASPAALLFRVREKRPFVDHLVRAYGRYDADAGDRLAASVTFYWFLSLFPILLLAVSLLGYVYGDEASAKVRLALSGVLAPELARTVGDTLEQTRGPAGVVGLLGTLYSGLGWIDGLREAIRTIWHQNINAGNIVTRKLGDVVVLVGLFVTLAASVVVTGVSTAASRYVLDLLEIDRTPLAQLLLPLVTPLSAALADVLLFLYLFGRLARVRTPLRRILKGAVLGAVGFEVLKVLGGIYVARTTTSGAATYGAFAVVVGLLLFLNLVSRLLLFTAAFIVTAPYDSDVAPSGTASPDMARRAGIPEEFVGTDPDAPPSLQDNGAPTPLQSAVQGTTPPQQQRAPAQPEPRADLWPSTPWGTDAPPPRREPEVPALLPGATAVRRAAAATTGALVVLAVAGAVYALRAVRALLRRPSSRSSARTSGSG